MSKYSPVYFGEKLNKEEIMEMMGVEFERKIREIFAATEVRQHEKKFIYPLIKKGTHEGVWIFVFLLAATVYTEMTNKTPQASHFYF